MGILKRSLYVPLSVVLALAIGVFACASKQALKPDFVRAAAHPGDPQIVVIRTSDNPLYEGPIKWFMDTTAGEVSVFTFKSGKEAALAGAVRKIHPRLVFTLGAQATVFAHGNLVDVPHVFAMVVNHRRLKMGDGVAGIALEPTPTNEFSQFKMILPGMKRVLAFHSAASKELVASTRDALKTLGIELQTIEVQRPEDVERAFPKDLNGIDAIWQMNDPKLVTEKVFDFLRDRSHQAHVPFIASLSEEFARDGAMAAVSVDFTSLGAQAATIVREILAGKSPKQVGVQPPIGAYLALNLDVAEQINAQVPAENIANVNKVFSTAAKQARADQAAVAAAEEAAKQEEEAKQEEAKREEEAKRAEEEAKKAEQEAKDAKKKEEAQRKLEELRKKEEQRKKQEEQRKRQEEQRKKDEARKEELAKKEQEAKDRTEKVQTERPHDETKPGTGTGSGTGSGTGTAPGTGAPGVRFVVFYDPDANAEAILQIASWFTKFLQAIDPDLKLQPVRSVGAFEQLQKKGQVSFAILPATYVRAHRGTIVPLLLPATKDGSTEYQKVLFAKTADAKPKTLAVTSGGASTKELAQALTNAGIPVEGVTIIPVSKDVDALLALVFGQVDAAVVKLESLDVVKTIQPQAAASLQKLKQTKPITRPPFVAISGVEAAYQAKVVAAMKAMKQNPLGARAMKSLGVDTWVDYH